MEEKWDATRVIEENKFNLEYLTDILSQKKAVLVLASTRLHMCNMTKRMWCLPDSTRYHYCLNKTKPDVKGALLFVSFGPNTEGTSIIVC